MSSCGGFVSIRDGTSRTHPTSLEQRINQLVANLNTSIDKLNAGQGTLGQLMVNAQLYESLNGATRETQQLMKDIRANPKKFLRIKLGLF